VATWNVADAADHLPLTLPVGSGLHSRLLPGAAGGSTPPRGRWRQAEVWQRLFQARPPPDRPQHERARYRPPSGKNRPRRSRLRRRRRCRLHLPRPRRCCGGQLCQWRLRGGGGIGGVTGTLAGTAHGTDVGTGW